MSFDCNIYTVIQKISHDYFFFFIDISIKSIRKYFVLVFAALALGVFMDNLFLRMMAFDEKGWYLLKRMLSDNELEMVIKRSHHHFKGPIGNKGYGLTLDLIY